MRLYLAAALIAASPATAGVEEALNKVLLPGFAEFTAASTALAEAAHDDCTPANLVATYDVVWDAWLPVGIFHLGPTESAAPHVAFWPDARGFTPKTLKGLIASESPLIDDPVQFAEVSVAGKGLFALERLLFDPAFNDYGPESYSCRLVRAVANDLAAQARTLETAWRDGYAVTLTTAGAPENATFLDETEATRALYTQMLSALEFTAENRLGRPMGTFERPRPTRAEAQAAGRSLANVVGSTDAVVALADALADWGLPQTHAALTAMHEAADKIDDPTFSNVDDPTARFTVEVLQQKVEGVETAIEEEIGLVLGLTPGFNASDGD